MAEVVGLIASVISILGAIERSEKLIKTFVHSSSSVRAELVPVLGKLTAFLGILKGLQLECELDESDHGRLHAIECVREPLEASKRASETITARLSRVLAPGGFSITFGKVLDKESVAALHVLDQSKAVLELALTADQRTLLKSIESYIRNVATELDIIRENLADINNQATEAARIRTKDALLEWVSIVNYSTNYQAALSLTREDDTCGKWLFNDPIYQNWVSSDKTKGLVLTGISGGGKTVICSKAIHQLSTDVSKIKTTKVVYFFFDFNDIAKQSVEGMVRSLIRQLVSSLDTVPNDLLELYSKHKSSGSSTPPPPSLSSWCSILISCLSLSQDAYVFIDALDECNDAEFYVLRSTLIELFRKTKATVRWFVTCRDAHQAVPALEQNRFAKLYMNTDTIDSDIQSYVSDRLQSDPRLESFGPKARELIVSEIMLNSAGMFRFAQCQLDILAKLKDRRVSRVRQVLATMPDDISSIYNRILLEIQNSDDWLIVERVLTLIIHCARPVTVAEATEFVILEDGMLAIQPEDRFEGFTEILSLLSSFVKVQDGVLSLAHKSVQEFLVALRNNDGTGYLEYNLKLIISGNGEQYIAKRCLQYLAISQKPICEIEEARMKKEPNSQHLAKLLEGYPFLDYAASRWPHHLRSGEIQEQLSEEMRSTLPFNAAPNLWKAWLMLQRADIWESQLQLARLLCEATIRSSLVPGWTKGFWLARQRYRVTKRTVDLHDSNAKIHNEAPGTYGSRDATSQITTAPDSKQAKGSSFHKSEVILRVRALCDKKALTENELSFRAGEIIEVLRWENPSSWVGSVGTRTGFFDPTSVKFQSDAHILGTQPGFSSLAVVLLEVALQRDVSTELSDLARAYPSSDSKPLLRRLGILTKTAANIMGQEYGTIIQEVISNIEHRIDSKYDGLNQMQEDAMAKIHSPLQSMLRSGFRASRSALSGLQSFTKFTPLTSGGMTDQRNRSAPYSHPAAFTQPPTPKYFSVGPAPPLLAQNTVTRPDVHSGRYTSPSPGPVIAPPKSTILIEGRQTASEETPVRREAVNYEQTLRRDKVPPKPTTSELALRPEVTLSTRSTIVEAPGNISTKKHLSQSNEYPPNPPCLPSLPDFGNLAERMPQMFCDRLKALVDEHDLSSRSWDLQTQLKWSSKVVILTRTSVVENVWIQGSQPERFVQVQKQFESIQREAKKIILQPSATNDAQSQFLRGYCHESEKLGFIRDEKRALACYQSALQLGHMRAAYRIGTLFEFFADIPLFADIPQALKHYQLGVDAEDCACLFRTGIMLLTGAHGHAQSDEAGMEMLRRAAELADEEFPCGAFTYGMIRAGLMPNFANMSKPSRRELISAFSYIRKAAMLGYAQAQLQVAKAYELSELGCHFDAPTSLYYSLLAAEQGQAEAQMSVSKWFLWGQEGCCAKSEAAAFWYAQRASLQELDTAQFALGYFYEVGIHVSVNRAMAMEWYTKAAAQGNGSASARLERLPSGST